MPKITEMYAFIAEEGPEDEGIVAMKVGNTFMPLVGADMDRVESLRPIAVNMANIYKTKITLAKFTTRTDLEEIKPNGKKTQ